MKTYSVIVCHNPDGHDLNLLCQALLLKGLNNEKFFAKIV